MVVFGGNCSPSRTLQFKPPDEQVMAMMSARHIDRTGWLAKAFTCS
jgi:hypothetical protein